MNKLFVYLLLVMSFFVGSFAYANSEVMPNQTVADVKIHLISQMKQDGYLSDKKASEVVNKYVLKEDGLTNIGSMSPTANNSVINKVSMNTHTNIAWSDYFSWINFLKVGGVILFLIAFSGIIRNIIEGVWHLIIKVPTIIYQVVLLSMTVFGTIYPDKIWTSQAFYVALFCSFANIVLLGWIVATYKFIEQWFEKIFKLGIPVPSILSFWGMIYFGALALMYHSSVFGFFAAICLSGVFSFGLYYMPGVLTLYFKENMLSAVVFGHILVLSLYGFMHAHGMYVEQMQYFNAGIQYYCTVALAVALLCGSSPFVKDKAIGLYVLMFIGIFFLASAGYFFWDMKVAASIIFCFFALFVIEWVGYLGYQGGLIVGSGLLGAVLYGGSLLLEKYSSMIILSLS